MTGILDLVFNAPNILDQFFISARNVIWGIEVVALNIYVILIVTLFFLLIFAMCYLPVKLMPYYIENKKLINKIMFFDKKASK